jgi:hypothetical protein
VSRVKARPGQAPQEGKAGEGRVGKAGEGQSLFAYEFYWLKSPIGHPAM